MTGSDHGVCGRQTFQDFNLARQTQAHFDSHPLRHFDLGFVALHDLDHKGSPPLRNDRFLRNDQCIFARSKDGIDTGKHARAQLLLPIVNATANPHRAAIGFNQRVHRLDDRGERSPRQSIDCQLGFLTRTDLGLKTFRQPEIEQYGVDVLNVDHVCTIFQVITHIDLLEARDAIKRGQYLQALQRGLGQGEFGT